MNLLIARAAYREAARANTGAVRSEGHPLFLELVVVTPQNCILRFCCIVRERPAGDIRFPSRI
jgi:hypothetical protein